MIGLFVRERYPDSDVDGVTDLTVAEWSAERDDWMLLGAGDVIEDPSLRTPLPVAALIDATTADEAMARALVASRNPVIEKVALQSRLDARRSALFEVLSRRDIALTAAQRTQIERCDDLPTLERWFSRALTAKSADDLLS